MSHPSETPLVSVVIPSRNRPGLVMRAVKSVLCQTYRHVEIIVVLDGPDRTAVRRLNEIDDSRMRVVSLGRNAGGAKARNIGVEHADGAWIAFLDDDDEWLPEKLERQVEMALRSKHPLPIISSGLIARSPRADYIWPNHPPSSPIADYLMQRRGLFQGDGLIQTSTIVVPAALMKECPFDEALKNHQDWDWLIRAMECSGTGIEFIPDPLVIWHIEEDRRSISSFSDWHLSMQWLDSVRNLCSRKAYAAFLLTVVSASAANQGQWRALPAILAKAVLQGRPTLQGIVLCCLMWILPRRLRRFLRAACIGHRTESQAGMFLV